MVLTRWGRLAGMCSAAVVAAAAPTAPAAWSHLVGPDFPSALVGLAQLALLAVAGWVLLVLLGAVAHLRVPGIPRALRRALIVPTTVGVLSIAAIAGPAQADQQHDLNGLPLPDRPVSAAALERTADAFDTGSPSPRSDTNITVRAGDTLWSIAADQLPTDASNDQITRAWHAWHETNRAAIGADPHLIHPGQVFSAPDPAHTEQDVP